MHLDRDEVPPNSRPRWLPWVLGGIFIIGAAGFVLTRDPLPREVLIATGPVGGMYWHAGHQLAVRLERRSGRPVRVLTTEGTRENIALLQSGRAHLAILQSGQTMPVQPSQREVMALAPLFADVVHLVVRRTEKIRSPAKLLRGHVAIGLPNSGMLSLSQSLLHHYGVPDDPRRLPREYFLRLLLDPALQGAVVTTGLANPDLERLLAVGDFDLIPIKDAAAIRLRLPHLVPATIPLGTYRADPPLPTADLPTVAATAVLAATASTSGRLVEPALRAVYDDHLAADVPGMMPVGEASTWAGMTRHPAARGYYEPYQGLLSVANLVQFLDASKELVVAIGAGLLLLWDRIRRRREKAREREIRSAKERLDFYLNETVRIERAQMGVWDRDVLYPYLEEVTRIKLEALESLTQEELRSDRAFLIFITQCASLIQKMQLKIEIGPWERRMGTPTGLAPTGPTGE